jgi:hypothetical protein
VGERDGMFAKPVGERGAGGWTGHADGPILSAGRDRGLRPPGRPRCRKR